MAAQRRLDAHAGNAAARCDAEMHAANQPNWRLIEELTERSRPVRPFRHRSKARPRLSARQNQRLQELLPQIQSRLVTPEQYQPQRAKILAEP